MHKYKLKILISILVINTLIAKTPKDLNHIPHAIWDSEKSNIGTAKIWFQDWSDYERLHISAIKDSFDFEPHPYAVTTFEKKYKNAIPYKGSNYIQLIGNITWKNDQNWEEGQLNNFDWLVDRDQNWTYRNKTLSGSAMIDSGKLHLNIKDVNELIIELKAEFRPYK